MKNTILKEYRRCINLKDFRRLVLVGLGLVSSSAFAANYQKFNKYNRGHLDISGYADYYTTNSNFNSSGSSFDLASGSSYQLVQTPFGARYVLADNWAFSTDLMVSSALSKNSGINRNNSTMSEVHFGMDSMMYSGAADLVAKISAIYPIETIRVGQDNSMNSEGVAQVTALASFQQSKNFFVWYLQGGYNYRNEGRSGQALWNLGSGLQWSRFTLGIEAGGAQTVVNDTDTNKEVARYNLIQQVDAGSYRFYSVNPSVANIRIWSELRMGESTIFGLSAGYPAFGLNYSKGLSVNAMLTLGFDIFNDKIKKYSEPLNEESALSSDSRIEKFQPSVDDGVDQGLFKPPPAPPPRADRKKTLPPTADQIQNQLDDAEMAIKLKKKHK